MVKPGWKGSIVGGREYYFFHMTKKLSFIHVNSQVRNVRGSEICMPLPQPSNSKIPGEL